MSELFFETELGPGELTLLAKAILLELEGSGESKGTDFGTGTVYAPTAASVWGDHGAEHDARRVFEALGAEHDARKAFEALGAEAGSAVFRSLEKYLLTNTAQAARNAEFPERYYPGRDGGDEEKEDRETSFLKSGKRSRTVWGLSSGADGEESEKGRIAGGPGPDGSGLPERLSEIFCRDARRYDGPFDRY